MLNVLFGLLGALIGSFLNVCIYRLPLGLPVMVDRSRCTTCGHTLGGLDMVPVLSWLFLKGHCRYCKVAISPQYALVELFSAGLSIWAYQLIGLDIKLLIGLLIIYIGIVVIGIDLKHHMIPDRINLLMFLTALMAFIYNSLIEWHFDPLMGMFTGFGVLLIISLVGVMGGGDIKYMTGAGLLLGTKMTLIAIYFAFISGGLVALLLLVTKRVKRKSQIAFGPYLVLGTWVTYFYGEALWRLYTDWFIF